MQIYKKRKVYKQARVWLQPGQKQKQNLNRGNLLAQQLYHYVKEDGLTLSHQSKILPRTISRRKSSIFFDTIRRYSEKKMEQLNSTKENFIFEIIFSQIQVWSDDRLKACLAAGEVRKADISIALITWDQSFISVLFKDILEAISLILHYRTTC